MPQCTESVTLRAATPADRDFLFAIYASTRDEELSRSGWDDKQKQAFLEMQFKAQSQHYCICYPEADSVIISLHEHPIGRLLVDRQGADITLVDIALLPEYRNRGIGTSLIQALLDEANTAHRSVKLHMLRWSKAARLYERLGFEVIGGDGVYFEMKRVPDAPHS